MAQQFPATWWHYAADHQAVGGNTMTTRIPSPGCWKAQKFTAAGGKMKSSSMLSVSRNRPCRLSPVEFRIAITVPFLSIPAEHRNGDGRLERPTVVAATTAQLGLQGGRYASANVAPEPQSYSGAGRTNRCARRVCRNVTPSNVLRPVEWPVANNRPDCSPGHSIMDAQSPF
jgi:hypothetical protein